MAENGWNEYQKLVLTEIDDLKKGQESLKNNCEKKLDKLILDVALLKERRRLATTIYGIIGGAIPSISALIYIYLRITK